MPEARIGKIEVFGPFWRAANSRTQDRGGMRRIIESGELWGRAPAYSNVPAVQAYVGPLPRDSRGFEFFALTPPDQGCGFVLYWRERDDQSVWVDDDVAKVRIVLRRVDQEH